MEIKDLTEIIVDWADLIIPERKPVHALTKLVMEEIPELLQNQENDMEFADVLILVLDYAHLTGIDAEKAVLRKMEINRGRQWNKDPHTGLIHHVK